MFDRFRKFLPGRLGRTTPTVPVVRLQGAIGISSPMRPGLTLATCAQALDKAFAMKGEAVALIVNSPGGSPVQSRLIHERIRSLAKEHKKDVLVFVEDVAASGGYMIAIAGDEIYGDPSSVVGSIGVVSAGFGFPEALAKLGIERRVHTAGESKAILDPFRPEREEDIRHLKTLQQEIHETFIDMVKARRGDVLSDDPALFSGLFWSGTSGRDLGLIDQIGDLRGVLRERYGDKVRIPLIGAPRTLFGRRQGVGVASTAISGAVAGGGLTTGLAEETLGVLEERALWARYGL